MRGLSVEIASVEAASNDPSGPITVATTLAATGLPGMGSSALLLNMSEDAARNLHLAVGRVLANLDKARGAPARPH